MTSQLRSVRILRLTLFSELFRLFERLCLKKADVVLTVCKALSLKARQFVEAEKVFQIEDFPVSVTEAPNPRLLATLRESHRLKERKVILYTGNFKPYQGIELLLNSFSRLLEKRPGWQQSLCLLLVGDSEERKALEELSVRLGISSSVIFAGRQPLDLMGSYMQLADCLVSPRSVGENTPLKVYSYMAAGKPIVATAIESHTQVLTENEAYLASPDPESFAEALLTCFSQAPLGVAEREKKVELAAKKVSEEYSRTAFEKKLVRLYDFLLAREKSDESETSLKQRVA